jgi:TolA-binding protein
MKAFCSILLLCLCAVRVLAQSSAEKVRAYELYEQKRFEEAAAQFSRHLEQEPADTRAALDYASILSQLNRHTEAAKVLEALHRRAPENEPAYFKLGTTYVQLSRYPEAEVVFSTLEKSSNKDMALAAAEALRSLRETMARVDRMKAEQRIFDLAKEFKHAEVVQAANALEKEVQLSFPIELQRLYAMQALQEYAPALERADALSVKHPKATDLMLVRADLLAQLGRRAEAEELWRKIEREYPAAPAAVTAAARLAAAGRPEEDRIYDFARRGRHADALGAINELEAREGKLSWHIELQRLYAWQALRQFEPALKKLNDLSAKRPHAPELELFRADLLIAARDWNEAGRVLRRIKEQHPRTALAEQADNRLYAIPPVANLDKWYWGEAYLSGDYLGRFGTVIGSGFARHGFFIQDVRWLQPYVEFRFAADTRSGVGRERSIIADNFVALSAGVRAQPFPTEYLFVYAQGGGNTDLLERREEGDWAGDYQVGVYGFKSFGPGTVLHSGAAHDVLGTAGAATPLAAAPASPGAAVEEKKDLVFLRGDWFADAGADFSYYDRFSSWIGYGQAHQGFRLFQIGPRAAVDAYAVENISWDVRGNYFDNLIELGPGARLLYVPRRGIEVVLRTEYMNGIYFGRDDRNTRGGADSSYDDFRVGLSVGLRW